MRIRQGFEERSRLGRLLVNRGYLTETQLEEGLRLQRTSGQRLGEVFIQSGWISQKELDRVLKHQSRYRNAAALVTMVTLPFQPLVSFAASSSANASQAFENGELYQGNGLSELTDDELSVVSGQGDSKLLARIAGVSGMPAAGATGQDDHVDVIEGLKLAANVFVPVLNFLDSELTISGIHYRKGENPYTIRADGALVLAMPERIDEIRMDNIRVIGNAGPSLGNVSIHDIRFHPDSRMTIYTR